MAGIERGPQTVGPGMQSDSNTGEDGMPTEETQDAERLAKLPEHERRDAEKPAEGGLVGGGAAGVAGGAVGAGDYAGRLNAPVAVADPDLAEQEARERETKEDTTDPRG